MLLLEHIYKTYYVGDETVHALDDASLHVKPKGLWQSAGLRAPAKRR